MIIRIIINLVLLAIGTLIADGYKNPLYAYWLSTSFIFIVATEFIWNKNSDLTSELENYKDRFSMFTIVKDNRSKLAQISLMPEQKIILNQNTKINLYFTSSFPISKEPNVKIITDKQLDIYLSNQRQEGKYYGGQYEYFLTNPLVTKKENKYFHYSFEIKMRSIGDYNVNITIDNGEVSGELATKLTVYNT